MCLQKLSGLLLLTQNQRQTCVASHRESSITWNISVRGHCVMTAPFPHTELTLPLLLSLLAYPFIIPPFVCSSDLHCLSFSGGGGLSFPLNLIKGQFKMAMTEPRSCQIAASFFPPKSIVMSWRHHFPHLRVPQPLIHQQCAYLD